MESRFDICERYTTRRTNYHQYKSLDNIESILACSVSLLVYFSSGPFIIRIPGLQCQYASRSELAVRLGRNFDDDLAPGVTPAERLEAVLDAIEADKGLVGVLRALELAVADEVEDALPDDGDHLGLVQRVGAPGEADEGDVLEQGLVHGDLFNLAAGEADDEDAAVPGDALCRLVDEADGVVDNVDALFVGRQLLDLRGPVGVVVRDDVIGAKLFGDFELARRRGRGDDGGAKRFGDWLICNVSVALYFWTDRRGGEEEEKKKKTEKEDEKRKRY